jgi:tetratricopeptide (TPR) repeat protein
MMATSACVQNRTLRKSDFPWANPADLSGPAVTVLPLPQPPAGAATADPALLGKSFTAWSGFGPVPVVPIVVAYDRFSTEGPRCEMAGQAMVSRLRGEGIAAELSTQGMQSLPKDRLALSVAVRRVEIGSHRGFGTIVTVSGVIRTSLGVHVLLDCRLSQAGQVEASSETQGEARLASKRISAYGDLDAEADHKLLVDAFNAAADDCIRKTRLVEVRARLSEREYPELLAQGRQEQAAGRATEAIALLAQAYACASTFAKALDAVKAMAMPGLAAMPVPAEAKDLVDRGAAALMTARAAGDFGAAADSMEQAVALAPWWASAQLQAGLAQAQAGRLASALKHFKFYLTLNPYAKDAQSVRTMIAEVELHLLRGDKLPSAEKRESAPSKSGR